MKVADISLRELTQRLTSSDLVMRIGSFEVSITSSLPQVAGDLHALYGAYPLVEDSVAADFYVELKAPGYLRKYIRPQVVFSYDGYVPFIPLPQAQAFAMFEWGLNWCISNSAHQFLNVHAAVVERDGKAFIFPGTPGSGKSTLCAALVSRGWRLLSDEMTLISLENGLVTPIPRPISLKNESIEIIQKFSDEAFIGEVVRDTAKGTVGHMRPPEESVAASGRQARPAAIIFPKYQAGAATDLSPLTKGHAFMALAQNSFNYHVLASEGFNLLLGVLEGCDCYNFSYQYLEEAVQIMDRLAGDISIDTR